MKDENTLEILKSIKALTQAVEDTYVLQAALCRQIGKLHPEHKDVLEKIATDAETSGKNLTKHLPDFGDV